ncbi:MAG: TIR domain-containing protein [Hyphomicrobiales bacterium]
MTQQTCLFISHSATDHEAAAMLCAALEARGLKCWIAPRDIPAGGDYAEAIISAIGASDAMVVLFSERANGSQHIRREVERALNYEKRICPVTIDNARLTGALDYFLATLQWTDASAAPLDQAIARAADQLHATLTQPADGPANTWAAVPAAPKPAPAADLVVRPVEIVGEESGAALWLKNRVERTLVEFLGAQGLTVMHRADTEPAAGSAKHELNGSIVAEGDGATIAVSLYRQDKVKASATLSGHEDDLRAIEGALAEALFYGMSVSPRSLRHTPRKKKPTQAVEAFAFYLEARRAFTAGRADAALALLDRALGIDKGFAMAHWAKGEIHAALGNQAEQEDAKREATRIDADHPKLPIHLSPTNPMPSLFAALQRAKWSRIADGLGWLHTELPSYDLTVYAWAVDPTRFRIETAAQLEDTGSTATDIHQASGALLTVAGGFYETDAKYRLSPAGMLVVDGLVLNGFVEGAGSGLILAKDGTVGIDWARAHADDPDLWSAIQAGPMVVDPGGINGINSNDYNRLSRLAVGLADGHVIFVAVRSEQEGLSLYELGEILSRKKQQGGFGCERALNLSGGPTSQVSFHHGSHNLDIAGLWPLQNALIVKPH